MLVIADDAYYNLPSRNLELCSFATWLADEVSRRAPTPLPGLRVEAWKDKASALRLVGRMREAEEALNHAASIASTCAEEREHCVALVQFARSVLYSSMERLGDSEKCLAEARATFKTTSRRKFADTFWQEAVIWQHRGNYDEAAAAFSSLIELSAAQGSRRSLSALYQNIAACFERAGRPWLACEHLARAIEIERELGDQRSVLQCRWVLGGVLQSAGRHDEAIDEMASCRDEFLALGACRDAVRVGLDVVAAKLTRDPSTDVTGDLKHLASEAARMGLAITMAQALEYLRGSAERRELSPSTMSYAKAFFDDVQSYPDMMFVPPQG
ncbi:MAG TPA: tetratricopeptide repeat protein [Thermoanaerobaculia bacterium]|nr:tetratricopeptide repeat protein [Thermoanaerobaculia bacterium]